MCSRVYHGSSLLFVVFCVFVVWLCKFVLLQKKKIILILRIKSDILVWFFLEGYFEIGGAGVRMKKNSKFLHQKLEFEKLKSNIIINADCLVSSSSSLVTHFCVYFDSEVNPGRFLNGLKNSKRRTCLL